MAGKLPLFINPQQPVEVNAPPKGEGWSHEIKFDGFRIQARIQRGEVSLRTKEGTNWERPFASVAAELAGLPRILRRSGMRFSNAIFDGEVVCQLDDGTHSLEGVQRASENQGRLHYYVYDLLYLNGRCLFDNPLRERREILLGIWPKNHEKLHFSESFPDGGVLFEEACRRNLEGIVSKKLTSTYRPGAHIRTWLKIKCAAARNG